MRLPKPCWSVGLSVCVISSTAFAQTDIPPTSVSKPRVLDDRLKLELFAEQPMLVTPTGIDVDHQGRVWVLESNTHFPPDGYRGHPSDRLVVLEDTDGDGRADLSTMFADSFRYAMSVAVKPVWLDGVESSERRVQSPPKTNAKSKYSDSQLLTLNPQLTTVFVATRGEIVLLRDTSGDLQADERTRLVHLETSGNYPHNGLAGIAFDALGWMYFGFGENLGAEYKIIGSDGVTLSGGGEGGNIYRCRPDGSQLQHWATGFWNPHASCFDAFGRLFTVDNDPDSRPPCRLLHIIPGGDYGYRFRNGRKGTHPFTAWNGELPGTLPMVSGTGEAPSGIVCYESDGFPADYLGTLLVGSWGDHRIDQFVLEPKGASFVSKPKPIVQGDENFRPVGLALAPDGSLYFSDWVLRDYKLHGKGRVWRLSANKLQSRDFPDSLTVSPTMPTAELRKAFASPRLDVRRRAARSLMNENANRDWIVKESHESTFTDRMAIEAMWASNQFDWPQESLDTLEAQFWSNDVCGKRQQPLAAKAPLGDYFLFPSEPSKYAELANPKSVTDLLQGRPSAITNWELAAGLMTHFLIRPIDLPVLDGPGLNDPFVFTALRNRMQQSFGGSFVTEYEHWMENETAVGHPRMRLLVAQVTRGVDPTNTKILSAAVQDTDLMIRRTAVQWIGEEQMLQFRPRVEALLADSRTTPDLVMVCLATLSLLDGVPPAEFEKSPPVEQFLKLLKDDQRPASLRATALRMIPAESPELSTDMLLALAQSDDSALKAEAVRTLQLAPRSEGVPVLLEIAANLDRGVSLRADAIAGLGGLPTSQPLPAEVERLLLQLVTGTDGREESDREMLRLEAIRALRGRTVAGSEIERALRAGREIASEGSALREAFEFALVGKSSSVPQLSTLNSQPGSPDSGRRVFFHAQGPLCAKCHTVNGRGGKVGPDLSVIARTMNREKLLQSILTPSKEISPQFLTWTIATDAGQVHTGIIVSENGGGDIELGDAQGNIIRIPRKDIDARTPSNVSVMPERLYERMTSNELADLLSFLESLK